MRVKGCSEIVSAWRLLRLLFLTRNAFSGIVRQTVTKGKHGKEIYKRARKSKWGGVFLKFHTEDEMTDDEFEGGDVERAS